MRRLLFILFCLPLISFGQNIPLTEKKLSPESEKLKQKNHNKSLAMHPKNQIGYIMNPSASPVGLNYYNFFNKNFGWYVDYRTGFNLSDDYWAASDRSFIEGLDMQKTGYQVSSGGYSALNVGLATRIFGNKYKAWVVYFGVGNSTEKLYDEYTTNYTYVSNSTDYVRNGGNTYINLNYGILRQTDSWISWQVGLDSTVPGINFGMGFTWN